MNNGHKTITAMLAVVAALVLAGSANGQCDPFELGFLDYRGGDDSRDRLRKNRSP